MKSFKTVIVILFFPLLAWGQSQTFVVSSDADSGPGTIRQVVSDAQSYCSNTGGTATVSFQVSSGLCKPHTPLPEIKISKGTIIFTAGLTTPAQGISMLLSFVVTSGYCEYYPSFIINNTGTSSISIKNLTFEGEMIPCGIPLGKIGIKNGNNVEISNCNFNGEEIGGIGTKTTGNSILIHDNVFTSKSNSPLVGCLFDAVAATIKVKKNIFSGGDIDFHDISDNADIEVAENTCTSLRLEAYAISENNCKINIHNNTVTEPSAIGFNYSTSTWKFENNTLSKMTSLLIFKGHGMSFVEPNDLGYPIVNTGNLYNGAQMTFEGDETSVVGLKNLGHVSIHGNSILVRENQIGPSSLFSIPITSTGNKGILPPINEGFYYKESDLRIYYSLSGLASHPGPYVVDFYTSTDGQSINEYLGTQTVTGDGHYVMSLNLPISKNVNKIGYTVTSLGSGTIKGDGTSTVRFVDLCSQANFDITQGPHKCTHTRVQFKADANRNLNGGYSWKFSDNLTYSDTVIYRTFRDPGTYTVTLTYTGRGGCATYLSTQSITLSDCFNCEQCLGTLAPLEGKKYVLSAWVKENKNAGLISYGSPAVEISFSFSSDKYILHPKGAIIEGWQKVEEVFNVPALGGDINITLKNLSSDPNKEVYFDDVRICPFDANVTSYVYDPLTMKLTAELDNNHFATFYDYDEEGNLVRVKKETEQGIVTVKENRSSMVKLK